MLYILLLITLIVGIICNTGEVKYKFNDLQKMDGFEFERYVTYLYQKMGYSAYTTQESGDFGADVIAKKGKEKLCIQCKHYKNAVGIEAVQQAVASVGYYKGTRAVVVTNSSYTPAALKLAEKNNAVLIDGIKLYRMVNKYMN